MPEEEQPESREPESTGRSKLIVQGGSMKNVGTAFSGSGFDLDVEGMDFENVDQLVTGRDIGGRWAGTRVRNECREGHAKGKGWSGNLPEMPWKRRKRPPESSD